MSGAYQAGRSAERTYLVGEMRREADVAAEDGHGDVSKILKAVAKWIEDLPDE